MTEEQTRVRTYPPPEEFAARANVRDAGIYEEAARDPEAFWAGRARRLHWFREWDEVLRWDPPEVQWFVGGKINASYNCLDYQVEQGRGEKTAIIWEGDEPGDTRTLTYSELKAEVEKFANVLKSLGVRRGDPVSIYLPMIPELPIAMLACARIGAPHSVVFGAFSANSLRDRINDCEARVLVTADSGPRGGKRTPLKANSDEALEDAPSVENVVVVRRTGDDVSMVEGRDHWWHELMAGADPECPAEEMDSEDILYILYSSGSTGKPKGIVHTTGGYLTHVNTTTDWVFDLKEDDIYWCTADIGWVTGHSYIVYGPLSNGATVLMFEGTPAYPASDRWWDIIERHRVNILYTAPTAIRAFMKQGTADIEKHDLSSLRLLGSVGEPINPRAWEWYHEHVGGGRCPVVDTWWQTETGGIMITPLPGITTTKPGSATRPFPGIFAGIYDDAGNEIEGEGSGNLVIKRPWPGMLRTLYKDPQRYRETYWEKYGDVYFAGDGARRDEDGYFWITGRVDDVINVSGHRISTAEVESALVGHPSVAEAAVIGRHDEETGQAIVAYVILEGGHEGNDEMAQELRQQVRKVIGAHARPQEIIFTPDLPKTRSGKIMRRILRRLSEGQEDLGDTTTLADPSVVETLRAHAGGRS
ncbi:acetate--CoA ligase [Rubrobacter taiwanensis]|jgi:acetyl-CoA synthetase|uniref:Acetyl-coenzyme A synthetase n=1 Tax=Rubrobacter taiwanensis TaxID=185139 RepID=A0A4V2NW72_9ACTN|nr:acetate--CoA ligase [Rubrobacter taiwanensis]TCJ16172.1 acetate--CoA ligase [Rubrobacter taiwanensis]